MQEGGGTVILERSPPAIAMPGVSGRGDRILPLMRLITRFYRLRLQNDKEGALVCLLLLSMLLY